MHININITSINIFNMKFTNILKSECIFAFIVIIQFSLYAFVALVSIEQNAAALSQNAAALSQNATAISSYDSGFKQGCTDATDKADHITTSGGPRAFPSTFMKGYYDGLNHCNSGKPRIIP
jgi:hypothetical protein